MGRLCIKLGEWEQAVTYLEKSKTIYENSKNKRDLSFTVRYLARAHKEQLHWAVSAGLYEQAKNLYEHTNDRQNLAEVISEWAELCEWQEDFSMASSLYDQASKLLIAIHITEQEADNDSTTQ